MSQILEESTTTVSRERRIFNFSVTVPPEGESNVFVTFGEVLRDGDGNVLSVLPNKSGVTVPQSALINSLPAGNLPDFNTLYTGLSSLFHQYYSYQVANSGIILPV